MEPPAASGGRTRTTEASPSPRGAPRGLAARVLQVPLLGKLAGANLLIVASAFLSVAMERGTIVPPRCRSSASRSA
jgi:hypothetical protein